MWHTILGLLSRPRNQCGTFHTICRRVSWQDTWILQFLMIALFMKECALSTYSAPLWRESGIRSTCMSFLQCIHASIYTFTLIIVVININEYINYLKARLSFQVERSVVHLNWTIRRIKAPTWGWNIINGCMAISDVCIELFFKKMDAEKCDVGGKWLGRNQKAFTSAILLLT